MKSKSNLYDVFKSEVERVGDKFTIFYNEKKQSLQYSNNEGALTVFVGTDPEGFYKESYFYRPADGEQGHIPQGYGSMIGATMRQNEDGGQRPMFNPTIRDFYPQEFCDLCMDYQRNRDAIGIDEMRTPKKLKNREACTVDR